MSDLTDEASELEQFVRMNALRAVNARLHPDESPDEDEAGNRFCLDCGEDIPPARVAAVGAVRCVECAGRIERWSRAFAPRDGGQVEFGALD